MTKKTKHPYYSKLKFSGKTRKFLAITKGKDFTQLVQAEV